MVKNKINEWKKFKIKEIYPTISHPAKRSKKNYKAGKMPFVASGAFNNGINCYLQPKNEKDFEAGDCLTISPLDGSCFYQPNPFLGRGGGGSSLLILRSNLELNVYQHLFIATVIRKTLQELYSFNNMANSTQIPMIQIKLPVTDKGTPDFKYMEEYMMKTEKKAKLIIDLLKQIK